VATLFTELEADDTITCRCHHNFTLNESQWAELAKVFKERNDEMGTLWGQA